MIKDLFLQFLIVLFPILMYRVIKTDKVEMHYNDAIIGIFSGLSIILCMTFPVHLSGDFMWDMRYIPLIIAFLYGGVTSGVTAGAFLIIFRIMIGDGLALLMAIVAFLFTIVTIQFFISRFYTYAAKVRTIICMFIAMSSYLIVMVNLALYMYLSDGSFLLEKYNIFFLLLIGALHVLAIGTASLLIEGLIENITIRKELQDSREKLIDRKQRYKSLVDNSLDAIGVIMFGKWVYMNKAGYKMFRAEQEKDLIGKFIYDFLHPDFHDACASRQKIILKQQKTAKVEEQMWYTCDGALIHAEVIGVPTTFKGNDAVQILIRDISERKQAEALMLQSEKLSIAGQLAAGIAHEIRNPITAVKGFLQLINAEKAIKREYFNIMKEELERIELILSELLMLAKPQEIALRETDLEKTIKHVVLLLDTQAIMQNVQIMTHINDENITIKCDENQIKQVFINFIKNAIDAMPDGGSLKVETETKEEMVNVHFTDSGHGIPKEKLEKIGQPFYSTKEKGTGLGLMVSYKIIENHGGSVSLISEEGIGTTFTVQLPLLNNIENGK